MNRMNIVRRMVLALMLLAGLATGAEEKAAATSPAKPAPVATAPVVEKADGLDEPEAPLQYGLSKAGRRHNSNCRYWKSVVTPCGPKDGKVVCSFCKG